MGIDEHLRELVREVVVEEVAKLSLRPRFRTAKQAAELLDISPAAVAARVRQGTLPGVIHARRVYVDWVAFEDMIAERSATLPGTQLRDNPEHNRGRAVPKHPRP